MRKKLHLLLLVGACLFGALHLHAQGTVKGKVTDNLGEPLIGANVLLEGTVTGTVTDFDGNYQLGGIPAGNVTIRVSYTGYEAVTRDVNLSGGETLTLNFTLNEDSELLDEVVVVGYGTKRKSELTGTISKINSDEISQIITPSFESALQGQAAGLQVVQGSGLAGSASVVRIRGTSSLSSGGDPLYVVDGIPITQDYFLGENRGNQNNNPLATLNPNDIESVEVLKDAAAAAIYGSRGANGVIIITTKRGKQGRPTFNFNARVGIAQPTNMVDFVNGPELLQLYQEAWENDGNTGRVPLPPALTNSNYEPENYTYEEIEQIDTDWFDEVIQDGLKQDYNFSMRQGSEFLRTYVGLSFSDNESYMVGNRFQRASGRVNLDFNISPKLDIGVSTSLSRGLTDRVDPLSGGFGLAQSTALPIYPIFNKAGEYFNPANNPVAKQELLNHRTIEWRSINNLNLTYRPVNNLTLTAQGNYDYMNLSDNIFQEFAYIQGLNRNTNPGGETQFLLDNGLGQSERWITRVNNWSVYGTAEYDFSDLLSPDHNFTALGGIEYQRRESNGEYGRFGLNDFVYRGDIESQDSSRVLNFQETEYTIDEEKFFSVFARLNYNYQEKYFLQFTFRRDGSSRFFGNKQFGNFPAVGVGWIISREDFWNNNTINFLKLKASWGVTGNSDISWREQFPEYSFKQVIGFDENTGEPILETNSGLTYAGEDIRVWGKPANQDVQWEIVNTIDVGVEVGFLEDRITADLTYYYQRTTDLFLGLAQQASSGWENLTIFRNAGELQNQGVDFSVTSRNIVSPGSDGFTWTTTLNLGFNQNKVLDVATASPDALAGGFGDTRAIEGEPLNTNFIIKYIGLDENGYPLYENTETGEPINQYREAFDRQVVGNGMPWLVGGLTNEFTFKNFDLSAFFVFSLGGEIYDDAAKRQRSTLSRQTEGAWTVRRDMIGNYWQQPGDDAQYARLTFLPENYGLNGIWNNNQTLWLEDADYLRLRTLTLGYTFPNPPQGFSNLRVYFTGQNLLTITEYTGWDPEVARERTNAQERNIGGTNITYLTPPQERAFLFGVNVDF